MTHSWIRSSLALALAASASFAAETPVPARPNVLVLLADDQTYRTVAALYPDAQVKTPNLDRLAREGMSFSNTYIQGGWSGAVCICSRACFISGLNLEHARSRLDQTPLLGETFRNAGYDTVGIGKWHNGNATLQRSFTAGGPFSEGMAPSTGTNGPAYQRPAPGNEWTSVDPKWKGHWQIALSDYHPEAKKPGQCLTPHPTEVGKHSSEIFADKAIDFLKARQPQDKPYLLYVAFNAPHDPRQAPKAYFDLYPEDQIRLPPNYLPEHPFDNGELKIRDEQLAPWPRSEAAIRAHRREYYAIITHLDAQIGRILETLDQTGQSSHTYVVFAADNGLAVGQHGLMGKQNMYDHSVKVPLIIRGPGIAAGKQNDALVYLSCVYPTVCELAGLPVPKPVETRSLKPLLDGTATTLYDTVYAHYLGIQRMLRQGDWKLIEYTVRKERHTQLFNLAKDPFETTDLANTPEGQAVVERLRPKFADGIAGDILLPGKPGAEPAAADKK